MLILSGSGSIAPKATYCTRRKSFSEQLQEEYRLPFSMLIILIGLYIFLNIAFSL